MLFLDQRDLGCQLQVHEAGQATIDLKEAGGLRARQYPIDLRHILNPELRDSFVQCQRAIYQAQRLSVGQRSELLRVFFDDRILLIVDLGHFHGVLIVYRPDLRCFRIGHPVAGYERDAGGPDSGSEVPLPVWGWWGIQVLRDAG